MNEKELLNFIEKLFTVFTNNDICFDCEIKKLDKSKIKQNTKLRNFCINEKLIEEQSFIYDKLTDRGKNLKRLKTFKNLKRFENNEPSFFTKHKDGLWFLLTFLGLIIISIPIYKSCDINDSVVDKNIQSHNPNNLNIEQKDIDTIYTKSELLDTLQTKK